MVLVLSLKWWCQGSVPSPGMIGSGIRLEELCSDQLLLQNISLGDVALCDGSQVIFLPFGSDGPLQKQQGQTDPLSSMMLRVARAYPLGD